MKYKAAVFAFVMLFTVLSFDNALAQQGEEERIKEIVTAETAAYFERDADGWQSLWTQDAKSTRTFASSYGISSIVGWENFGPAIVNFLIENPEPTSIEVQNKDFLITTDGNSAWVEYEQTLTDRNDEDYMQVNRQQRALVKENGQWKVRAQISLQSNTFDYSSPQGTEMGLNALGYNLMAADKTKEAIEVFQLNVKWFPSSWNVYDSLGEAYAMAGQNELAIENYKKSIELNPENVGGKEALAKLTGQ